MRPVYLDYAASAPLSAAARDAVLAWLAAGSYGHASSTHQVGRSAEAIVSRARTQVATLIGARPHEIVFTGSGTEANNLALKGAAEAMREAGHGDHIVTTAIEHESVLEPCQALERSGFRVTRVPVDERGAVSLEALERAMVAGTILVSGMLVNHEIGKLLPVDEIATLAHRCGALVHTDASLAPRRVPVSTESLGVDLMTLSSHKFGGPQGVGALFVKRGLKLRAQLHGGHHERKRRAGAENVPGILGMGAAADHLTTAGAIDLRPLTTRLWVGIQRIPDVRLNGDLENRSGILSVAFDGVEGESILMNLDLAGICVSSGSPCSSGSLDPSPVLLAMGLGERRARSSVRFSLGPETSAADVDRVLEVLPVVVKRLREVRPVTRATAL